MSDSPYSGSAIKRSAGHFLIGKIFSALLTFSILLWLVRLLSTSEYAAYVTLVAFLEITFVFTNVGLPWIDARYLPDYRLHAPKAILIRFIVQLILCQLTILSLFALLAWFNFDWLLLKTEMTPYRNAAQLYIFMMVIDGCGRRLRDSILSALLQQKIGQSSLVLRNFVFLSGLAVLFYQGKINLANTVSAELFAATLSILFSLIGLLRYLKHLPETTEKTDWLKPTWLQMWGVAKNMYFSGLLTQAYSSHVFTLIIRQFLGAEATAIFGFVRNLYFQVANYLPATLLFGLIRPKLVASYVGDGGIAELTYNANIVGKISLFVLMPLLVFAWLSGETLLTLLSGGKFIHTGYYFAGLLCALVPLSQRQILETVAVVTGNSHLCNFASLLGIITLPVTYGLIQINFGLWAPIIAIVLGQLLFCSTILRGVMKKTLYHADYIGFYKLLLVALLSYLVGILIILSNQSWLFVISMAILACSSFLLIAFIIKPFSETERSRINRLIKRNLFVW